MVLVLLGDDPSPLEVLVERLVQQLQTTTPIPSQISPTKFKIQRERKKNKIAKSTQARLDYRIGGADLNEQRRDEEQQQRAPSHHPLCPDLLEPGARGVSGNLPTRAKRPREGADVGGSIRSGRGGVAARLRLGEEGKERRRWIDLGRRAGSCEEKAVV